MAEVILIASLHSVVQSFVVIIILREHYEDILREAGFANVTSSAIPFGPTLEAAAALLGLDSSTIPPNAPERRESPVLLLTGCWGQKCI